MTAKTIDPLWSILVCTVPNRRTAFGAVWDELERQVAEVKTWPGGPYHIEILGFCDNKTRSVGYKRQALLDIARGKYVSWVDDDDWPLPGYVETITEDLSHGWPCPDVICFPIYVTIDGKDEGIVDMGMAWVPPENGGPLTLEEYMPLPARVRRPPHMLAVWRTCIARRGKFSDESFRDDFKWARQVWPYVENERVISDEALYHWRGRTNEEATVGA